MGGRESSDAERPRVRGNRDPCRHRRRLGTRDEPAVGRTCQLNRRGTGAPTQDQDLPCQVLWSLRTRTPANRLAHPRSARFRCGWTGSPRGERGWSCLRHRARALAACPRGTRRSLSRARDGQFSLARLQCQVPCLVERGANVARMSSLALLGDSSQFCVDVLRRPLGVRVPKEARKKGHLARLLLDHVEELDVEDERLVRPNGSSGSVRSVCDIRRNPDANLATFAEKEQRFGEPRN